MPPAHLQAGCPPREDTTASLFYRRFCQPCWLQGEQDGCRGPPLLTEASGGAAALGLVPCGAGTGGAWGVQVLVLSDEPV